MDQDTNSMPVPGWSRRVMVRVVLAVVLALLGGALRFSLAHTFNTDWDEDDYLVPAGMFRQAIDHGDWHALMNVSVTAEHPPLVKILYGLTLERRELAHFPTETVRYANRIPLPAHSLRNARLQSVAEGALTILAVALVSLPGGLALAVQSIHVHFSSVAVIDALPTLFTALAAILYTQAARHPRRFWLSAACFGVAVAAKYPYALAGVAILFHALLVRRLPLAKLIAWGVVAIAIFFVLNPYIWPDPVGRIRAQMQYHEDYTRRPVVHHDTLKPIGQLLHSEEHFRHLLPPGTDFTLPKLVDRLLFVMAIPGLVLLLRQRSVYAIWLIFGLAFLMVWPSQWIQHKMIILVPYSISAGEGMRWLAEQVRGRVGRWRPSRAAAPAIKPEG